MSTAKPEKPGDRNDWRQLIVGIAIGAVLGVGASVYLQGVEIATLKEQINQLKSQNTEPKLPKEQPNEIAKNEETLQLIPSDETWGKPVPGSSGKVTFSTEKQALLGTVELRGLKPNHAYTLSLDGSDQLPQRKGEAKFFDFLQVTSDLSGNIIKEFNAPLPSGDYSVKFFVKNNDDWKIVLYNDFFHFKIK